MTDALLIQSYLRNSVEAMRTVARLYSRVPLLRCVIRGALDGSMRAAMHADQVLAPAVSFPFERSTERG